MTRRICESLQAATRLVFDSVSYSNPLPEWQAPDALDYDAREALLARRIDDYLAGRATPKAGVRIGVPRRNGSSKTWVVPTVNDQILLQTVALRLARVAESRTTVDYGRVFSYEINREPSRLAFTQDQLASWSRFVGETSKRVAGRQMLQFDLEQAYASIDLGRFVAFFRELAGDGDEVRLLDVLLRGIGGPQGLPLINNSLFYLGNVYLTVIDEIVGDHTDDFIRFVDDYRVFDTSQAKLERMLASINRALAARGFRTNPNKTRLGDENSYADAVRAAERAAPRKEVDADYGSRVDGDDVVKPEALAALVSAAAKRAGELSEGMGRYLMQSIRQLGNDPTSTGVAQWKVYEHLLYDTFDVAAANASMTALAARPEDEWRLIWMLYVAEDLPKRAETFAPFLTAVDPQKLTPVARCWYRRFAGQQGPGQKTPRDAFDDMSYLDGGHALYGA